LTIRSVPFSRDGASYYRIWLPFHHLADQGKHVYDVINPDTGMPTNQAAGPPDVVVLQRPAGKYGVQMLEQMVGGRTKLVYECDDDMLNVESAGLPHLANDKARNSIKRCIRLCDMVTVSSEHLAGIYQPYNENIVVLPNHIKAGMLDIRRTRKKRLTVGFAGGNTHAWDVEELRTPLRHVLETNDVDMHFVGEDHSPILGRQYRWTAWEPDVGHYYRNVDFDIALAPIADNLFNRSKTAIRALEMGALGVPIVASNRLPYSDYVIDGTTGFLCDTDDDWVEALTTLINDEGMREKMGAAGREQAAGWTIEEGWKRWEQAYEDLAGG
jgi:glycosyltransferase involved in cell wall biosynthesis